MNITPQSENIYVSAAVSGLDLHMYISPTNIYLEFLIPPIDTKSKNIN